VRGGGGGESRIYDQKINSMKEQSYGDVLQRQET